MGSGIIILSIIALLFLGMYLYAYGTTKFSRDKENNEIQKQIKTASNKQDKFETERQERLRIREENSRLAELRSKLIKKEIKRLNKLKEKQNT